MSSFYFSGMHCKECQMQTKSPQSGWFWATSTTSFGKRFFHLQVLLYSLESHYTRTSQWSPPVVLGRGRQDPCRIRFVRHSYNVAKKNWRRTSGHPACYYAAQFPVGASSAEAFSAFVGCGETSTRRFDSGVEDDAAALFSKCPSGWELVWLPGLAVATGLRCFSARRNTVISWRSNNTTSSSVSNWIDLPHTSA